MHAKENNEEKIDLNFDEIIKILNKYKIKYDRATLEINNTCNIDCLMCKTSLATRKKGKMEIGIGNYGS